jgi:hypothetical protein
MEVNLRGTLLSTQLVLPEVVGRRRGRIVNVSGRARGVPVAAVSAYCRVVVTRATTRRPTDPDAPICVRLTRLVADVLRSFSGAA